MSRSQCRNVSPILGTWRYLEQYSILSPANALNWHLIIDRSVPGFPLKKLRTRIMDSWHHRGFRPDKVRWHWLRVGDYNCDVWWRGGKVDKERGGMLQSSSSGHYCFGPLWLCGRDSHDTALASDWSMLVTWSRASVLSLVETWVKIAQSRHGGWDCRQSSWSMASLSVFMTCHNNPSCHSRGGFILQNHSAHLSWPLHWHWSHNDVRFHSQFLHHVQTPRNAQCRLIVSWMHQNAAVRTN